MRKNKAVLTFLLRFFVSYFVLSGLYQYYLKNSQQTSPEYQCCSITEMVTNHTVWLGSALGYNFNGEQNTDSLSLNLFTNGNHVAFIVEGCNSVSVIILFWAFIIAFSGTWKKTLLFGIIGMLAIYVLNIFRIVFISIALDKFPQYSEFLHQILFPAIIYGFTFILWVIWVRYFALKDTVKNTSDV